MKTLKLSLFALLVPLLAFADGATVVTAEGEGQAGAIDSSPERVQAALDEATRRAQRAAVEAAAGVRLESETTVLNNQLVKDTVVANSSGYLKSTEVLSKKNERGVWTVRVRAQIITENLDKDILAAKDLVKRIGRPSLLILIQEQTVIAEGKGVANSENVAAVLTERFRADGWEIKDEKTLDKKAMALEGAVTFGPTELKRIADVANVDYIIYGKASIRHEAALESMKGLYFPVAGEYDLAMAATDSGSQIAKMTGALRMSTTTKETGVNYERTAFRVVREKSDEIVGPVRKALLEHFRDQEVNGRQLSFVVKGLDSFRSAGDFKKSIETIKGVRETTQDKFTDGKGEYRVVFMGTTQEFAEAVESATFKKKKLNITAVSRQFVEVQVAK